MKQEELTFNDLPAVVGELCNRIASMENLLTEKLSHQHEAKENTHVPMTCLDFLRENKLSIAQQMQELTEKFGQSVLDKFLYQIQIKCNETERKIRKADSYILIPHLVFYILIIILVALSSFFASIIIANAEILHSTLIWKAAIGCIFMAALGIGTSVTIQNFLDRGK